MGWEKQLVNCNYDGWWAFCWYLLEIDHYQDYLLLWSILCKNNRLLFPGYLWSWAASMTISSFSHFSSQYLQFIYAPSTITHKKFVLTEGDGQVPPPEQRLHDYSHSMKYIGRLYINFSPLPEMQQVRDSDQLLTSDFWDPSESLQ